MKRLALPLFLFAIAALVSPSAAADEKDDGFKSIFNGKDLTDWDGDPKFWSVKVGAITGQTTKENPTNGNTFIVWTAGETGDFELKLQYKIIGGNSGIQYRSFGLNKNDKWRIGGYQADFEAGETYSGILYGEAFRGILANRGQKTELVINDQGKFQSKVTGKVGESKEIQSKIKKEDWNDYHIVAQGFTFKHFINGVATIECEDKDEKARKARGVLALQLHAGPPMTVQFKDIRIKGDTSKKSAAAPSTTQTVQLTDAKPQAAAGAKKKIVFVAGNKSHGFGSHDHKAGCHLLADQLNKSGLPVECVVTYPGWPKDMAIFDGAAAIVIYSDGGGGHPMLRNVRDLRPIMDKGVGLGCLHYAVEVPKGEGGKAMLDWTGGYFETFWSVNPHWTIKDAILAKDHPITNGVKPFSVNDEWYYHMRFREDPSVIPILSALPPADTMRGFKPDSKPSAHGGNPDVYKSVIEEKKPQAVMWARQRPVDEGGGRGFGFTGGHVHWNWANDNHRTLVLNGIAWIAGVEVPKDGVPSKTPTPDEMLANHDEEVPANFDKAGLQKKIDELNGRKSSAEAQAAPAGRLEVALPAVTLAVAAPDAQPKPKPASKPGGKSPEETLAGLEVHPDLQVEVFAAEPNVLNPANIDIDHKGRIWVAEIVNYRGRKGARPEGDRIVILEDKDGDGKAEDAKTFYQDKDFISPHGVTVFAQPDGKNTRVIVAIGDKIIVLTDENGDDKADKSEVLFTGISGTQHDHGIHQVMMGPDGKMYFNFGNSGNQIKDKNGKQIVDKAGLEVKAHGKPYRQGMVFRCNMDGSDFETLGWNFRNNWMNTVDSFGTIWQSDNDDDGNRGVRINYVMEFGNYGYQDEVTGAGWGTGWNKAKAKGAKEEDKVYYQWHQFDPGVVPNLLHTGAGSPTGICVYEAGLLPEAFRGQVIHCDAGPNVVRAYPVKKSGAGYTAEMLNVVEGKGDKWFRPSDVKVAPDGSLIIADWYDPGVGGHAAGDLDKGRIFRVTPKGHKGYKVPAYKFDTAENCVAALHSPTPSVRSIAWTELNKMGAKAEAALKKVWDDKSAHARKRARALWLLGKIEGKGKEYVAAAIKDKDADIRITGLRLARQVLPAATLDGVYSAAYALANDPDPAVRRECLIALRDISHVDPKKRVDEATDNALGSVWAKLAKHYDGKDRWYLEALGIGAERIWGYAITEWADGDPTDTAAERDILWRMREPTYLNLLVKLVKKPDLSAEEKAKFMRSFDYYPKSPEKDKALLEILN